MKSIIQTDKRCYLCGSTSNLEKHHVLFGTGLRPLSDKYGLTVWLCSYHHRDNKNGVHGNAELARMIKKKAQEEFEKRHPHELWMEKFGRNYL